MMSGFTSSATKDEEKKNTTQGSLKQLNEENISVYMAYMTQPKMLEIWHLFLGQRAITRQTDAVAGKTVKLFGLKISIQCLLSAELFLENLKKNV